MSHPTIPSPRIQRLASEPARSIPPDADPAWPVRSLHLNEAPFPPAPKVIEAMREAAGNLNRYPDHEGKALSAVIAELNGVSADRIVVAAGSNELLYTSAALALEPGDEVVAPSPGFPAYAKSATLNGAVYIGVPNLADGLVDIDGILAAITPRTRLVFVCSPHNPTGGMLPRERIEHLIAKTPDHVLLVFDEAYYEFGRHAGGPETIPLLEKRKGPWIATRSFSKAFGLAGVRVGYGIAHNAELASTYKRMRTNFSVNSVALAGGKAALEETAHMTRLLDHNAKEREKLATALTRLGFAILPSAANFLTAIAPTPAADLAAFLKTRNIFVVSMPWPGHPGALRISIGSSEDMDAVIAGLEAALTPSAQEKAPRA